MNYFTGDSDLNNIAGLGTPVIVDECCINDSHLVIDNHSNSKQQSSPQGSPQGSTEKYVCLGYLDNEGSVCFHQCKPLLQE
jgi:hypothetical protein